MTADQLAMEEIRKLDALFLEAQKSGVAADWEKYHQAHNATRGQLLRGFWTKPFRPKAPNADLSDE